MCGYVYTYRGVDNRFGDVVVVASRWTYFTKDPRPPPVGPLGTQFKVELYLKKSRVSQISKFEVVKCSVSNV